MNEIQLKQKTDEFRGWLNSPGIQSELARATRAAVKPITIARVVLSAMVRQPALLECSKASVWSAVLQSLELGLLPDGREAAMVPYKGTATLQPMYQGLVKLCSNMGTVVCPPVNVYRNERFRWRPGAVPPVEHEPLPPDSRGEHIGTYAVALTNGQAVADFMWMAEIDSVRHRSAAVRAGRQTPWDTDPGEMAKKTVFKRLAKYLPKSAEMLQALAADDEIESGVAPWSSPATLEAPIAEPEITQAARLTQKAGRKTPAVKEETPQPPTAEAQATVQPETSRERNILAAQAMFLRCPPKAKENLRANWGFASSKEFENFDADTLNDLMMEMTDALAMAEGTAQ